MYGSEMSGSGGLSKGWSGSGDYASTLVRNLMIPIILCQKEPFILCLIAVKLCRILFRSLKLMHNILLQTRAKNNLEGHGDERVRSREYNIALGEQRAKSVANMMKVQGLSENQLEIVSYGEEKTAAFAVMRKPGREIVASR